MTERIGAIVLAGGRSSRFGRDKLAEIVDGRPLLDHAIDAVRAVATDIVVVVAPGANLARAAGRPDRPRIRSRSKARSPVSRPGSPRWIRRSIG